MMSFLTAVVTSRYPTTNNQLRTLSNPRQQAIIYDGKVTVQPVLGRQTTYAAGTTRKYTPGASGSNTGKQRIVICYKPMIWMLMTLIVINLTQPRLLSWRIFPGMAQMHSLRYTIQII
ncbi:hypothetical protein Tco_1209061 [Tanacetum coccineum]